MAIYCSMLSTLLQALIQESPRLFIVHQRALDAITSGEEQHKNVS